MDEHLARQRLADLFVDTFAFNAHTTATEALWAGLPVVTKAGQGFAARVAGSLLNAIGLPELVTTTEQDYEELILELATNPTKLAQVKDKLATNRLTQPLFNTELYTKHLENGYHQAYQNYFDGNLTSDNHCTKVKRKTTHRHLYLPKDYSGSPTASLYTPWTEAEVLAHLTTGWGEGAITELKLEYLYGPEPEVSGE